MAAPLLERVAVGTPLATRVTGGWRVTHTRHLPHLRLQAHRHAEANLVCVLRGSFDETVGRATHGCGDGSVVVKPAGEEHSNQYGARGADCVIVEALPVTLRALGRLSQLFESVRHLQEPGMSLLAAEICAEAGHPDSASGIAIEALATELVARGARTALREQKGTTLLLERAREFLHDNFQEEITLSRLAEAVGRHPAHVSRIFRKGENCSVGAYVRKLRLQRAATELLSSDRAVSAIAVDAGFYDHAHFCRVFKAQFGVPPVEFRRASRAR